MFPQSHQVAYLDTAAEGLPLAEGETALAAYFTDKSVGSPGRRHFHVEEERAQSAVARLLGAHPEDVALISCCSEAVNVLANSIHWKPGDEVLISDLEFPSGALAWLRLRDRGVILRVLPSEEGRISLKSFHEAIGKNTRVVYVSHVSYKTGTRLPFLLELSKAAHEIGALFVVDATQSLGRLPVTVDGIDFLVASGYKWLLGVHGLSVVYMSPSLRDRLAPGALGWYSVRNLFTPDRFEQYALKPGAGWIMCGMPAFPSIYVLRRSVEFLLELGVDRIDAELRPLVAQLRQGIEELGFHLITPPDTQYASGIVSFSHPDCERIAVELEERNVIVWAGDGRVRASLHLYNDRSDIERYLRELAPHRKERECTSGSSAGMVSETESREAQRF
jgi:cysteine desulfurase/selenocysteine lyase